MAEADRKEDGKHRAVCSTRSWRQCCVCQLGLQPCSGKVMHFQLRSAALIRLTPAVMVHGIRPWRARRRTGSPRTPLWCGHPALILLSAGPIHGGRRREGMWLWALAIVLTQETG